MTVIAWDGKTLAADRRACLGNMHRTIHKLHRMTDCLCASAGESDAAQELIAWFEAGRDPAAFPPSQPLPPVVGPGVKLTPLPASVTEIDLKPSDNWREKVRNYLLKLEAFSINEKPR